MKLIKHLINGMVWSLLALYLTVLGATRLPVCQEFAGQKIAGLLAEQLGTQVSIGRVDLGLLNRLILDDVCILDQQQQEMLRISRLTARVSLSALGEGKIHIASAQLFGAHASLYQKNGHEKPNFQFIIDSLAPKDTTSHTPLDLRINSLIIRHSSIRYDRHDARQTPGLLNPSHLNVSDISAHIVLKELTDSAIDLNVKRFGLQEQSGLAIDRLCLKLKADHRQASLRGLVLEMPSTSLRIDSADANYQWADDGLMKPSVSYRGAISESSVSPSDLRCFFLPLKNFQRSLTLSANFSGTWEHLDIQKLTASSEAGDIRLDVNGYINGLQAPTPQWRLNTNQLALGDNIIDFLQKNVGLPPMVKNIGNLQLSGTFGGEPNGNISANASIRASIGQVDTELLMMRDKHFSGCLKTSNLNLQRLTADKRLGTASADLRVSGEIRRQQKAAVNVEGKVSQLDYNGYPFRNIALNGSYSGEGIGGLLRIDDPNIEAELSGQVALASEKAPNKIKVAGSVRHLAPQALHLTDRWGDATFAGQIDADCSGRSLKDLTGQLRLKEFSMKKGDNILYCLDNLFVTSEQTDGRQHAKLVSDFAKIELEGNFEYETLPRSIANIVGSKLPELPGLPPISDKPRNDFALSMQVYKSDWLQQLLGIDLDISQPLTLDAKVNDSNRTMTLEGRMPGLSYNGATYTNGQVSVQVISPMDTLRCSLTTSRLSSDSRLNINLNADAADNNLKTSLRWNDGRTTNRMSGELNAITRLYTNLEQKPEAHVRVQPSHIILGDTVWSVEPSDMLYSEQNLLIDHFNVHHHQQHITIDGRASKYAHDSLTVDLNEVEVAYILDLVDFHTVEFSGKATGKAVACSLFDSFEAYTNLTVNNFKFENGRMGTLLANAAWNKEKEQIDIDAVANDGPEAITLINGFVSPTHNTIDLAFGARGTYIDFMHSFTNSFLSYVTGHADGDLRLAGTLDNINLTGQLTVEGKAMVTPLNTEYELHRDTIVFIPDEIELHGIPLTDRYGNSATLSGGIHHQHLTNLTFDLAVNADNLLAYDFKDFGEGTFYGTVFASGDVSIKGRPGEVTIDCDVTPQKNTVFVYNASSPDAISKQEFIHWGSAGNTGMAATRSSGDGGDSSAEPDTPTDIYINLLINCSPDATLRLLMDANTDDYITLNGEGAIRAQFYNKGPFNMFGTYTVDRGTYGVTIQNIIQKNFTFNRGGTIVFGGDPYNAALNLQALYTVNGVSLTDLNIGNSFASNTIRVNCLMNISGQPNAPQVDFDLEMPTVNADEQQMVRSVINGQQEMNQQVLYLLAIGRFYNQAQNNADAQQQDQTSLAMQSFLSGTLSTQINNLLNTVIKNDNWNIGANISTGNEGWHNAEYEGTISGRMLNNRLLLNGQFGYRDNAKQATPSFIGDFDIQYLLLPNGNLSLKMYNQTNDRYFTKSSLNTQGIGLIMKKDFNGLGDLFSSGKKKRKKSSKKSIEPVSSK